MDFEQLGAFYLGRVQEPGGATRPDPLLYDAKDLTTHAVCVGMTGSGKTGLCVTLLEEAAIDGIPAIVIDPKGDLGNLLLTFPRLRPEDFEPWVDPGAAARKGQTVAQYAAATAAKWKEGIGSWGQDGARIRRLKEAAEFAIYTPGSDAGRPLTVLRSFDAPPAALVADGDAFRERVSSAVSGLLALLGLDADPVLSREHILLSSIVDRAWRAGQGLDLATLIRSVQTPGFDRIGVLDLESVFPQKDRFALAMRLNNLLASPGFQAWLEGEPLSIPKLLWTPEGKPRIAVLSIAHLGDAERMFFVTLLLNEVVAWMRTQPGTSSLRALLYMDEVFGYFPPTANPPSKRPMLTLLKQARAFGLGVVLATQNPVDLDYKGLSNCGTWFLGRLQTERDKLRVLDGLEGAAGGSFDRAAMEATLSGLKSRVFLMNNVHEDGPVLFHTRWALSYLRGPLTRTQIRELCPPAPKGEPAPPKQKGEPATPQPAQPAKARAKPQVPTGVEEAFWPAARLPAGERLTYRPALLASGDLHYANARAGLDHWERVTCLAPLSARATGNVWAAAENVRPPPLDAAPLTDADFAKLPKPAARKTSYTTWAKSFKSHLYKAHPLTLWKCTPLKLTSEAGESEAEFKVRVREAARERRDLEIEKLRKRYAAKFQRIRDRIRTAEQRLEREQAQYSQQKTQTTISLGATILGALFGRKAASVGTVGRAATTARGASRAKREEQDVARAKASLKEQQAKLKALEADSRRDLDRARERFAPDAAAVTSSVVRPRKTDMAVDRVTLAWVPFTVGPDGIARPVRGSA